MQTQHPIAPVVLFSLQCGHQEEKEDMHRPKAILGAGTPGAIQNRKVALPRCEGSENTEMMHETSNTS